MNQKAASNVANSSSLQSEVPPLRIRRLGVAAALLFALLPLLAAQRAAAPPAEAAVPFRAGEQLDYRVGWQAIATAATVQFRVVERRPFYGRTAWHFQTNARTVEPASYLYSLNDQFDSYTDTTTLGGIQYEMYIREQDRKENNIIRMSTEGEPASGNGPSVRVPAGTRDPIGTLFWLRAVDWAKTAEARTNVYDGKKLYELRVRRVAEREEVRVVAGQYTATKLELRVYDRGREVQSTSFVCWLAQDAARTPVLIEAETPVGDVRVELTAVRQ